MTKTLATAMMNDSGVSIRPVAVRDRAMLPLLHSQAFAGDGEARLVTALQDQCDSLVSLVAELDARIVAHILFSPCHFVPAQDPIVWGLAPMAVTPQRQHSGIGGQLVRAGLEQCRARGVAAVVVLGHPEYYPRFGFRPALEFGLRCNYDVPDNAFMAIELQPGSLSNTSGVVHYHPLFGDL